MIEKPLKVLVACESSGTVRDAFARLGHDATSCDLLPTERPGKHYQGDARDILDQGWDLMIGHPTCTYLTSSAEWAYKDPDFARYPGVGYHQKLKPGTLFGAERRAARVEAVEFFLLLWNCGIPRICLENPVGHMSQHLPDAVRQTIQPYQFGHDASKGTTLWLRNLPKLTPTLNIAPRMVNGKPRWANQTDTGQNRLTPGADRWRERSRTYPGIAEAMAAQWGITPDTTGWKRVSFACDCDGYDEESGELGDICSICGLDYCDDCECPGPTQDGMEYETFDGVLYARPEQP